MFRLVVKKITKNVKIKDVFHCEVCNYIKNNYDFNNIMDKLLQIYDYHIKYVFYFSDHKNNIADFEITRIATDISKITILFYINYDITCGNLIDFISGDS